MIDVPEQDHDAAGVLRSDLASCEINSTMSDGQINRLRELNQKKKSSRTNEDESEKKRLSQLWERERLYFGQPFHLWIDWWGDVWAGGSTFKTWAGKQFVIELVRGMQDGIRRDQWVAIPSNDWLTETVSDGSLPLYFDSDVGRQSASLDVGFSLDALKLRSATRPMVELAAFVGLQRFRPAPSTKPGKFSYFLWRKPLPPILAAAACCGCLIGVDRQSFEFPLLYRTRYLKGFLPAQVKEVDGE